MTKRRIRHLDRRGHNLIPEGDPRGKWRGVQTIADEFGVSAHWLQLRAAEGLVATRKVGNRRQYRIEFDGEQAVEEELPIQQHLKAVAKGQAASVFEDDTWTTHTGDDGRVTRVLKSIADAKPGLDQERIHAHIGKAQKEILHEVLAAKEAGRSAVEQMGAVERLSIGIVANARINQIDLNGGKGLSVVWVRSLREEVAHQAKLTRHWLRAIGFIIITLLIAILAAGCGDDARQPTTDAEDATEVADSDCATSWSCYELWEVSCGWHADGCGGLVDCGECPDD